MSAAFQAEPKDSRLPSFGFLSVIVSTHAVVTYRFDYIARRVTAIRAFDSLSEDEHAGTPYKRGRKADTPKDVIKVNERESLTFGQKVRSACCS